ncbi:MULTISPECIES: SAVMC3_10250 family protein [unclassified Streptomyces]|uniref:SAVMC3_10250 family protein n=1 Tax=unclassified Streptomyces TaxID=2593676 RepID=UPI0011B076BB|nr:SAVMC3_10250 family protein [Streptomyces sp. SM10]
MRQVVYLSKGKLQQFPWGKKSSLSLKDVSAEVSVASIATLSATAGSADAEDSTPETVLKEARKVLKHLKKIALQYENPRVSDGAWIRFDTRLAQALVWAEDFRMLFFGPHPQSTDEVALLLYGNPSNLTTPPGVRAGVEVQELDSAHDSLIAMIQAVAAEDDETLLAGMTGFREGVIKMAERVEQQSLSFPRLSGYAQVVATFDCTNRIFLDMGSSQPSRLVVASPLIVECLQP